MTEKLARRFHDIYERLAPNFGYETRKETREFDPTTPNGKLMIAVTDEIEEDLLRKPALVLAHNFVAEEVSRRELYLYDSEVNSPDLPFALPANRCVKITIEFSDIPEFPDLPD